MRGVACKVVDGPDVSEASATSRVAQAAMCCACTFTCCRSNWSRSPRIAACCCSARDALVTSPARAAASKLASTASVRVRSSSWVCRRCSSVAASRSEPDDDDELPKPKPGMAARATHPVSIDVVLICRRSMDSSELALAGSTDRTSAAAVAASSCSSWSTRGSAGGRLPCESSANRWRSAAASSPGDLTPPLPPPPAAAEADAASSNRSGVVVVARALRSVALVSTRASVSVSACASASPACT